MFNFLSNSQNISAETIILNIALSFVLALMIAWVYQKTHRGLSYSQSYVNSLILLCTLSSVIMMVIGNVLIRAVALLGAFTIIRFRTVIKDPKDISFILFVLIIGMGVGTGGYTIAIISTIMIIFIAYLLYRMNFGSTRKNDYVLSFSLNKEITSDDIYESVLMQYLKKYELLNINTHKNGKIIDLNFGVRFLPKSKISKLAEELSSIEGIENVSLIMSKNEIEY